MERCIFCNITRKTSPHVRFFGIPREPGLKRVQWLYVLGDREIVPKDRVCEAHFLNGRPTNDPSHEDFVPHLNMNKEPPEVMLAYLESLDDSKDIQEADKKVSMKPSILHHRKKGTSKHHRPLEKTNKSTGEKNETKDSASIIEPSRVHPIHRSLAEAIGAKQGQTVIVKRYVIRKKCSEL